ncbi:MAG: Asp-tRNA(Asn)/Glu-tRNA(Gln) amidotransferase subunit GatB [Fretibacterium sp.]|nr:Asp-tRNA(Asn)/Glu-tRNA(Gln) amidotransferase subunit GatB [Fretibacterium sp.]
MTEEKLTFMPVIGIEIHIQLKTNSKIFCSCSTDCESAAPNTNICPVCMGLPGALPFLNRQVVQQGMLAGMALNGTLRSSTLFFRKSYFYPDLPKGFQTSQCDLPIMENGWIEVQDSEGNPKKIRIHHLHLEEDVGRLQHSTVDGRLEGADTSFVDYNRSGLALAEIVSEPDVASAREAVEFVTNLRRRVRYSGASDVDLEKGMMRFDANVSLKCSDGRRGDKVEVKNMNSFRALERAIDYEIARQTKILSQGESVLQETRHWNDARGVTTGSRTKEFYRKFIVEPDLPPLVVDSEWEARVRAMLPEMPEEKMARYIRDLALSEDAAAILTDSREVAEYFEACVAAGGAPVRTANWVLTDVLRCVNEGCSISAFPVSPKVLADLVTRIEEERFSTTQARAVFDHIVETGSSLAEAVKLCGVTEGGFTGSDLAEKVRGVLEANPDVLEEILSGKDTKGKKVKFLQGLVMKETRGSAKMPDVEVAVALALEVAKGNSGGSSGS